MKILFLHIFLTLLNMDINQSIMPYSGMKNNFKHKPNLCISIYVKPDVSPKFKLSTLGI